MLKGKVVSEDSPNVKN